MRPQYNINRNLEQVARQLYDYWFIQFDFPNHEGKPYKSSGGEMVWNSKLKHEIPSCFSVVLLSNIIEVKDGTHDSPKSTKYGYYLITSKHLTENGIDFSSAYHISENDWNSINLRSKVDNGDILFSMIGTIGNKYIVDEVQIDFAIKNMALFKTSCAPWFRDFFYMYLGSFDYEQYQQNSTSGSIQKFMSLNALRNIPIIYCHETIHMYASKMKSVFERISNNKRVISCLLKMRDGLLPLLLNGQVNCDLSHYHIYFQFLFPTDVPQYTGKKLYICAIGQSNKEIDFMKEHTRHNIICLEAEWEYSEKNQDNRFSLNTLPMLNWLKEAYDCEVIYRRFRTKSDLKYYLDYFRTHAKGDDDEEDFSKYDIIYFACHGEKKCLWIEGKSVPLKTLARWAKGFFKNKIIHFSSCRTMSNKNDSKQFKRDCQALMVSGYQISVDAMDSSIADIAIMNDLLSQEEIEIERYTDMDSEFYQRYESLLNVLHYHAC